jgi:hypothetical protein
MLAHLYNPRGACVSQIFVNVQPDNPPLAAIVGIIIVWFVVLWWGLRKEMKERIEDAV